MKHNKDKKYINWRCTKYITHVANRYVDKNSCNCNIYCNKQLYTLGFAVVHSTCIYYTLYTVQNTTYTVQYKLYTVQPFIIIYIYTVYNAYILYIAVKYSEMEIDREDLGFVHQRS